MNGVEVDAVVKDYGATRVLDAVSVGFAASRFTSLLGPSGSGKTTLLRIIGGFVAPDAGRVRIGGADVTAEPLWKRNIGMVFQSYALFPHMSVADNVAFGLHRRGIRGRAARDEVARVLDLVKLTGFDARRPKELSGGQQQRVALARAIVTKPRVLLLDEPLSALDRRLRQDMQIELRRIQRDSGLTTIFVTHDQEEALTLSDHVAILDKGRIVQEGAPDTIYEQPRTRFAASFLGDANFFTGPVVQGGIEVAGQIIRCDRPAGADRTVATVSVRPEKIVIEPTQDLGPDGNRLDAVLEQVVYAGAVSTYLLRRPDGEPIKVLTQNRTALAIVPPARVSLAWSPSDTVLLEDR